MHSVRWPVGATVNKNINYLQARDNYLWPGDSFLWAGDNSDVKSSRPSCPRGQNFVLGLEDLSSASDSASSICPRPVLELFILAL